jgi:hypothetical protein
MGENISVSLNRTGEPVEFSWRGSSYRVVSKPERWFSRRQWWAEASRVQRGIGKEVLEVEMWRLRTKDGFVELMHTAQNDWRLVRTYH